jgi:hypothetical protein
VTRALHRPHRLNSCGACLRLQAVLRIRTMTADRLLIHVGGSPPEVAREEIDRAIRAGFKEEDAFKLVHQLARPNFPWPDFAEVRWLGSYTSDCSIALCPSLGQETIEFLEGAETRGEMAIVLYEVQGGFSVPERAGSIAALNLRPGVAPRVSEELNEADKDLALRILQTGPTEGWSTLALSPPGASGELIPLLVEARRRPVAAVWIPPWSTSRWYLFPPGCKWESLLDWVVNRGLSEYAPEVTRRVRALVTVEDRFLTEKERAARKALDDFEVEARGRRQEFQTQILAAEEAAAETRDPLLHGSGEALKNAVDGVLSACGFKVEDLDATLEDTLSGDLLVSRKGKYWLVEVTGASGAPSEREVSNVTSHLLKWNTLQRQEAIEGGILIVNHHRNLMPAERPDPYTSRTFLESLPGFGVGVISTVALCSWWANGECERLVEAITGDPAQFGPPRGEP